MPSRTLPGLELEGFAPYQEDNWNDWMDPNLLKLSVMVQLSVQSRTTLLPGAPSEGDKYIVPTGETNGDSIAVFDDGEWVYYVPKQGTLAWIEDAEAWRYWDGTEWAVLSSGGGGGAADFALNVIVSASASYTPTVANGKKQFVRLTDDNAVFTVPEDSSQNFDVGTVIDVQQAGANAVVFDWPTAVTVESRGSADQTAGQFAIAGLIKVAANTWVLTGDVE